MRYKLIITIFILALYVPVNAQNTIDNVLDRISENNLRIRSTEEMVKYRSAEYTVGLAPYDPFVSYNHLFGSPGSIGDEKEFSLDFMFDFPTVYSKKNSLADLRSSHLIYDQLMIKQEVLLEAKLICIEIIYYYRRKNELTERYETAERIHQYLRTKLNEGDLNIMEVNKARLQAVTIKSEIELNEIEITHLNTKLTELNGGKYISYADTDYPVFEVPSFTVLEGEIEEYDPLIKHLNSEYRIIKQEVEVNEALRLPKIEIGYRYKNQLGGNFNGFHAGISIPLWEKNNTVRTKELQAVYTKSLMDEHINEHYFEVKQLYDRYVAFRNTINESKDIINSIDNIPLYERALLAGEISSIEYLLETTYLYSVIDKMDSLEKEMNLTLAELLKHKLINRY